MHRSSGLPRRRPLTEGRSDPAFAVSGAAYFLIPAIGTDPRTVVWLGVLAIVGVFEIGRAHV